MRYLQYGQIKTTNRQIQTFRDLKSERSDRSRIGHESMSFIFVEIEIVVKKKKASDLQRLFSFL